MRFLPQFSIDLHFLYAKIEVVNMYVLQLRATFLCRTYTLSIAKVCRGVFQLGVFQMET